MLEVKLYINDNETITKKIVSSVCDELNISCEIVNNSRAVPEMEVVYNNDINATYQGRLSRAEVISKLQHFVDIWGANNVKT